MEGRQEDRQLAYDIPALVKAVQEMKDQNNSNKRNREAFLEYIDTKLASEWNTEHGREAIEELRKFAEQNLQEYISYLDRKIDIFEDSVIPALNRIDKA